MPLPFALNLKEFVTDESIAVRAVGDYLDLCPEWQKLAYGTDGVFAPGSPWVLNSASSAFATLGVASNNVIALTGPKPYYTSTGELFAVDSVVGNAVTIRRINQPLGSGLPPAPSSGLNGITFKIKTFGPQIDAATYDTKLRFNIDETQSYRGSGFIYDLRVLEQITVLTVLVRMYGASNRSQDGDWASKLKLYKSEYDEILDRVSLRWGQFGNMGSPVTRFSCRITR